MLLMPPQDRCPNTWWRSQGCFSPSGKKLLLSKVACLLGRWAAGVRLSATGQEVPGVLAEGPPPVPPSQTGALSSLPTELSSLAHLVTQRVTEP